MELNTLHDVLVAELADLYSAEGQLVTALPRMADAAHSDALRQAFLEHLEDTREHVHRLETALNGISIAPPHETCKGMKGLIAESEEIARATGEQAALDAALIAAAQRVEHYEMAGYGTARTLAGELGYSNVETLLGETLAEEAKADKALTKLARGGFMSSGINQQAAASP
jgi:ferritin-like metal-binding protein YciE